MYWRESMAARTACLISSSTTGRDSGTAFTSLLRGSSGDAFIASTEVEQRLAAPHPGALHAPHEDRVIALDVRAHGGAFELCEGAVDERHAEVAQREGDLVELVESSGGKAPRGGFLLRGEHVHREAVAVAQRRIALRFVIDAHEHQRGIERHRAERARGETGGSAVAVDGGENRHSGREVTENAAKVVRSEHRFYVAGRYVECKNGGLLASGNSVLYSRAHALRAKRSRCVARRQGS